jgi:cysteine desulfurase
MIDLDANASTPLDPAVLEAMLPFLQANHANPSAAYRAGRLARRAIEHARVSVATLLQAEPGEIIFTSGATESIHTAHHSVRSLWPEKPLLITTRVEHAAGLAAAEAWQSRGGRVHALSVDAEGRIDLDELKCLLASRDAALVSILWANNETGVIQPMAEITALAHEHGALVHADAVQMAGKLPLDLREVPVDLASFSGHKMHAPKGVGVLYVSALSRFEPLITGGGQERGRRSGTENVPGIVALGKAAELASCPMRADLRDALERRLRVALPEMVIHGRNAPRLPNTSNFCLPGIDAAGMLILLDQRDVACSAGSACHSASLHPSHVLEAMGYDATHAASSLRLSLHRFHTLADMEMAAARIIECAEKLRSL